MAPDVGLTCIHPIVGRGTLRDAEDDKLAIELGRKNLSIRKKKKMIATGREGDSRGETA